MVSFYDAVERERAVELADAAEAGAVVLVVSDAGMPMVSDPGYRLVTLAVERGHRADGAPGAVGGAGGTGGVGPARRPVLLRGLPPAQGRRAGRADRGTRARAPDDGVLRGSASARRRCSAPWPRASAPTGRRRSAASSPRRTRRSSRGPLAELVAWAGDGVRGEITVVVGGVERRGAARGRGPHRRVRLGRCGAHARGGRHRAQAGDRGGRPSCRRSATRGVRRCDPGQGRPTVGSGHVRPQGVLPHDADLLRQRRPAHRARLHDDGR